MLLVFVIRGPVVYCFKNQNRGSDWIFFVFLLQSLFLSEIFLTFTRHTSNRWNFSKCYCYCNRDSQGQAEGRSQGVGASVHRGKLFFLYGSWGQAWHFAFLFWKVSACLSQYPVLCSMLHLHRMSKLYIPWYIFSVRYTDGTERHNEKKNLSEVGAVPACVGRSYINVLVRQQPAVPPIHLPLSWVTHSCCCYDVHLQTGAPFLTYHMVWKKQLGIWKIWDPSYYM